MSSLLWLPVLVSSKLYSQKLYDGSRSGFFLTQEPFSNADFRSQAERNQRIAFESFDQVFFTYKILHALNILSVVWTDYRKDNGKFMRNVIVRAAVKPHRLLFHSALFLLKFSSVQLKHGFCKGQRNQNSRCCCSGSNDFYWCNGRNITA